MKYLRIETALLFIEWFKKGKKMKKRIIVYGLGKRFSKCRNFIETQYEVIGYCDKDDSKCTEELKKCFIEKQDLEKYDVDYILVTSEIYFDEIKRELISNNVPENKVISLYDIEKSIYNPDNKVARATSYTDTQTWPYFCIVASEDSKIFDAFRRNTVTLSVCEYFEEEWDKKMLESIENNSRIRFSDKDWTDFLKSDEVGCPICKEYLINHSKRMANCMTLRYVRILQQLLDLFDNMNAIESIAEIGGGYGGQCRIIMSYLRTVKYTLIDLPEVLQLMKSYLGKFEDGNRMNYIDGTSKFEEDSYDLVISNYAISEMIKDVQEIYIEKIVCHAKRGFIIWNNLSSNAGGVFAGAVYGAYS